MNSKFFENNEMKASLYRLISFYCNTKTVKCWYVVKIRFAEN